MSPFRDRRVWLPPEPRGVIQFIGGFVFGSFPAQAYRPLLGALVERGWAVVLHRFPFNPLQFDHWQVALGLLKQQQQLQQRHPQLPRGGNDLWLGHSLGCKFIVLLEILSTERDRRERVLRQALPRPQAETLLAQILALESSPGAPSASIRDQPSLFLAPEISNTVRLLRSDWQIANNRSRPTKVQTEALIHASQDLFNLTSVVGFDRDAIAEDDVAFLTEELTHRGVKQPQRILEGWHLQPLGLQVETLVEHIVARAEAAQP